MSFQNREQKNHGGTAEGYSVWLMPEENSSLYFSSLIRDTCKQFETQPFEPHVTLLGNIQGDRKTVIEKTKDIAQKIDPYSVSFEKIGYSSAYFKSFFLQVKETPEVMGANEVAQSVFTIHELYMPHFSLAYGNFNEDKKKEVALWLQGKYDHNQSFDVVALYVYKTEGTIDKWSFVEKFPLS